MIRKEIGGSIMLYELIKEKRMKAKLNGDVGVASVLTILLGEVDRVKDTKGTDDNVIISVVNKMHKSAEESIVMNSREGYIDPKSEYIIKILKEFRPKQLDTEAIRSIVGELISKLGNDKPVGIFMKELKLIEGMDMKIAANHLKELLK